MKTVSNLCYNVSINKKYGEILGNQQETVIEDNIFIGWGATILAGSHIGSNSIIGAGSIVSGKLEGNAVYAGNPAHKIMSIEDYYEKRKKKQLAEAVNYVKCYKECFGCNTQMDKMDEYFYLFFNPENGEQREIFNFKLGLMGNYEETIQRAEICEPMFSSYNEFIQYCENQDIED